MFFRKKNAEADAIQPILTWMSLAQTLAVMPPNILAEFLQQDAQSRENYRATLAGLRIADAWLQVQSKAVADSINALEGAGL